MTGHFVKALFLVAFCATLMSHVAEAAEPARTTYNELRKQIVLYDLSVCPDSLADPEVFCGLAIAAYRLNVFAFHRTGDRPLVGAVSYDLDRLDNWNLRVKR